MTELFMLQSNQASREHDSLHPNTEFQKMKSELLNTFISLHYIQKDPKVRWGLDVCLEDVYNASHHKQERDLPGHSNHPYKAEQELDMAQEPLKKAVPWPDRPSLKS